MSASNPNKQTYKLPDPESRTPQIGDPAFILVNVNGQDNPLRVKIGTLPPLCCMIYYQAAQKFKIPKTNCTPHGL